MTARQNQPVAASHERDGVVSRYYDLIYWWADKITEGRAFAEDRPHTIHRALADPTTGDVRPEVINDIICDIASHLGDIDALDAGCGYGGVALELRRRLGGRYLGITINQTQIDVARRTASALKQDRDVTFEFASYDAPLGRSFNFIYGIESLIHSSDPAHTIANLASALRPGGRLVIVDDMPVADVPERYRDDVAEFARRWHCPVCPTAEDWARHLTAAGLTIDQERDLTSLVRPRPEAEIVACLAEYRANEAARRQDGLELITDAEIGGVLLERLNREGIVRYKVIVARR